MFRHVGDLLAEMLAAAGVRFVFGVPGGQTEPLYDGIAVRRLRIDHILMRDERSGVFAADGYARASGTLGVCDATAGPGATNLVSGLAEALNAATPLLAIVADLPRGWEDRRLHGVASQGFRQAETLRPVTKAYLRLDAPATAAPTIARAVRLALSGRPGPVVLEIPDDVFSGPVPAQEAPVIALACPLDRSIPSPDGLARAADLLAGAERPVILAGSGAIWSGAWEATDQLALRLGAPIVTSITGKGIVAEGHPLAGGVAGMFGTKGANALLDAADVIVAVGCKLGQLTTFSWRYPRPDQRLIQIDIDPAAMSRSAVIALIGDARESLAALASALDSESTKRTGWGAAAVARARDAWAAHNAEVSAEPGVVDPRAVVEAIAMMAGPDDLLVCDASLASGWGAAYFPIRRAGRRFLAPRGMAGLGWGGPAAIGAQAALGGAGRVFALIGDGGWGYSLAEVETAVRARLPVSYVILNNGALAWVLHDRTGENDLSTRFAPTDYAAAARAMGATAVNVGPDDDLEMAFATALRGGGASLLDVRSSTTMSPILSPPAEARGA